MASTGCWKCLARPALPNASQLISASVRLPAATFSTSSFLLAAPAKAGVRGAKKGMEKGNKTLKINKKTFKKDGGKPPAPGERKALRKRIVLSNTNALEVEGLQDVTAETLVDEATVGKVYGIPGTVVDQLRASEAFQATQAWKLFRRPGMLIRKESVECSQKMQDAQKKEETLRLVVDGVRVSGKSLMLIHAMTTAFVKGWIVMSIPEAQEVVNAVTDYAPLPGTPLYTQNVYTAAWLGRIAKANKDILDTLKLSERHDLPIPVEPTSSLTQLCELGARDPEVAWAFFQAFWTEITAKGRPPILLTLDSIAHIMAPSLYRSPEFELIHSHDLTIVKLFVEHLSGKLSLPNGGAVIGATARSHAPVSKSLDLALKQQVDRQAGGEVTKIDPYERKYDARSDEVLQQMEVMMLQGLTRTEARGLMEYWAASGLLRARVDEKIVVEKWALAAGGIVGEIERGTLYMKI